MTRAGPEGKTRPALARQEASADPAAWQAARVARQEVPAGQGAWEVPAGQGAWAAPAGQGAWAAQGWPPGQQRALEWPPSRHRAPGLPPDHVGQRKPSSSDDKSETAE